MSARRSLLAVFANRVVACVLLAAPLPALALQESLSFRQAADGSFQAVVSGLSDGEGCRSEFTPPVDIAIDGAAIAITSIDPGGWCSIPLAPVPYVVVAPLGRLAGARYEVTWTQTPLQLSGVLIPAGTLRVFGAPTLSAWALAVLAGLLVVFASVQQRGRPR